MRFILSLSDRSSLTISKIFILPALLVLVISGSAHAEPTREHQCERSGVMRIVELQTDYASGAPCRVLYHKPMENQPTANLWNAKNDAQFCETKYDSFIEKLENKLAWTCSLKDGSQPSPAQEARETLAEASATLKQNEQNKPSPSSLIDSSAQTLRPTVAAALPQQQELHSTDATLSMSRIRSHIPSGTYTAVSGESQTKNPSICPSSGFFIWNTKSRENPVFEMGADHAFRFELAAMAETLTSAGSSTSQKTALCDIPISTGYCEQDQYVGATPLHPALRNYFACDNRSNNPGTQRPLVLASTLPPSDRNGAACETSKTSRYMALAPSQTVSGRIFGNGQHDLELIILPNNARTNALENGRGSVCRYTRGGLR